MSFQRKEVGQLISQPLSAGTENANENQGGLADNFSITTNYLSVNIS